MNIKKEALIGVCQWSLEDKSPAGLRKAKEAGYEGVGMDLGLNDERYDLRLVSVCNEYIKAAKESRIEIPSISLNFFRLRNEEEEQAARTIMDQAIEIAQSLSSTLLMLPSFGDCGIHSEECFQATVRILKYASRNGQRAGVRISSENQLDVAGNLRLMEAVGEENCGIYFDSANPVMMDGRDGVTMLNALYDHVFEIHVKDYTLSGNRECVLLGEGECQFMDTMAVLKDRSFDKWVINENALPEAKLMQDALTLSQILNR